ncbi:hypothetical protein [Candidatus Nephthysia bennettiae]|uniref:Uncharacterized protein n=1 Tax=Candidatus Nephthysia bennettiae TaxID=3127016 RepID=A0A934N539_9BACT|nr:hypothetical protein [Candidatus Dormibacteraeota bacterium]
MFDDPDAGRHGTKATSEVRPNRLAGVTLAIAFGFGGFGLVLKGTGRRAEQPLCQPYR